MASRRKQFDPGEGATPYAFYVSVDLNGDWICAKPEIAPKHRQAVKDGLQELLTWIGAEK